MRTSQPSLGSIIIKPMILSMSWSVFFTKALLDDEKQPSKWKGKCEKTVSSWYDFMMACIIQVQGSTKVLLIFTKAPKSRWEILPIMVLLHKSCLQNFEGKKCVCSLLFFGGGWGGGNATVLIENRCLMWQCANGLNCVALL